jgi:LPS export ABC transporter protein LptC
MIRIKKTDTSKILKRVLIAIMVLVLISIIALYASYRYLRNTPAEEILAAIPSDTDLAMGTIHHTATRDGRTEWTIDAESASLVETKNQLHLKNLSGVFHMKNNGKVHITAKQGIMKTDSKDIEVIEHVIVKNDDYRLATEQLSYRHEAGRLFTTVPVKINSNSFFLAADTMSFDIKTNIALFEGNVEATFNEKFKF